MSLQRQFNKFNDNIKISLQDEKYKTARTRDDSITKAVIKKLNDEGYKVLDNFIQGSFKTHTAILSKDGDFDIDRAIVIDYETAGKDPVDCKKIVLEVLEDRGFKKATIKKPCITADYSSESLHIDLPIYAKLDDTLYLAVGRKSSIDSERIWAESDPIGQIDWIKDDTNHQDISNNLTSEEKDQFRRIVKFLKRWRDEKFSESKRKYIYSIGITIMVKECFIPQISDEGAINDLLAIKDTISKILKNGYFTATGNDTFDIKVLLPTMPYRDVFDKHGTNVGTKFKSKLENLKSKLEDVELEENLVKQCELLVSVFGEDFPIPSTTKDASEKLQHVNVGSSGSQSGA